MFEGDMLVSLLGWEKRMCRWTSRHVDDDVNNSLSEFEMAGTTDDDWVRDRCVDSDADPRDRGRAKTGQGRDHSIPSLPLHKASLYSPLRAYIHDSSLRPANFTGKSRIP